MYILKVQGTKKIPDYIQIRDDDFFIVAYFRITHPQTALTRCNLLDKTDEILRISEKLAYGKIEKLLL
ncbi:MAG: fructose-6-phosphate aldolase [bacterium]